MRAEISCMNPWKLFRSERMEMVLFFLLDGSGWELMGMDGSYGNGWELWELMGVMGMDGGMGIMGMDGSYGS